MAVQGVLLAILYKKLSDSAFGAIQNVTGYFSMLIMTVSMSGTVATISTFNTERPVYIRERSSNTYFTIPYFVGRTLAYIPLEFFLPVLVFSLNYFTSHVDYNVGTFFLQLLALELIYWMSSSYGLAISASLKSYNLALALISIIMIPLMMLSGYLVPLHKVPDFFLWI